jgi:hypothetical protein
VSAENLSSVPLPKAVLRDAVAEMAERDGVIHPVQLDQPAAHITRRKVYEDIIRSYYHGRAEGIRDARSPRVPRKAFALGLAVGFTLCVLAFLVARLVHIVP